MLAFKGQRAFSYLKISVPCGCRPKARQIRWTPEVEIPLDRASLTSSNGQCPVASLPGCDDHRLDFGIVDRRAPGAARHGGRPTAARRSGLAICTPFHGVALSFRAT